MKQEGAALVAKTVLDRVVSGAALFALAPVIGATAAAIRLTMGGPVFFRQCRPGRRGRPIEVVKFRTMTDARTPDGTLLPDADRLTTVGSFVRSTSLDELPQLWNVLRGDMSLVGPRPLMMEYLDRYSADEARRHEVMPGITGWAQVNGRNALAWPEKLALDVWYVDHWSLALDAKIAALTVLRILQRRGISLEGHATMPPFLGSNHPEER